MRVFVLIAVILLAAAGGEASAATQAECVQRCPHCGDGASCDAIFETCMNQCMAGPSKSAPLQADVWGAIAVSPSTLLEGHSWNFKSEAGASNRALTECRAVTKAHDCKVVITVADVCLSLAISKPEKVYGVGGPGPGVNYANGNATLHCQRAGGRSCAVVTSFCADGILHQAAPLPSAFGRRR